MSTIIEPHDEARVGMITDNQLEAELSRLLQEARRRAKIRQRGDLQALLPVVLDKTTPDGWFEQKRDELRELAVREGPGARRARELLRNCNILRALMRGESLTSK